VLQVVVVCVAVITVGQSTWKPRAQRHLPKKEELH